MPFDQNNKVIKLCAKGMDFEGQGKPDEASKVFQKAWDESSNSIEKFTAAHYVARHQKTVSDKLEWDKTALEFALKVEDKAVQSTFPSLYLNIGKCYEDLGDLKNARSNYLTAKSYFDLLPTDGYGNMIKAGVESALGRVK